jgi:radical SAM protein with 4Fe4S-binding SPASM domain
MTYLNNWKKFFAWCIRHSIKSIPVSNGALGMGCIGYPGHPVWEVTTACNLGCIHCHAVSGNPGSNELSTEEGKKLIDQIAQMGNFRTLIYTGGEPLVRPDIFELLHYSKRAGLANIIATNGTLIDEEMAWKLKECGVVCNAISIDATDPNIHNFVRNKRGAFELALRAIEATKKAGILLQINTTAMEYNMANLEELIDFVDLQDCGIMLMYQLVTVGRGEKIKDAALKTDSNQKLIELITRKQKNVKTIIEPVAGPQYWPYMLELKNLHKSRIGLQLAKKVFHGCAAGRDFFYIKANGDVWPCPFVEVTAGNVREEDLKYIYEESVVFNNLKNREISLKGLCGECNYKSICGGCRGRAWAYTGDYLSEDPSCFIREHSVK